MHSKHSCIERIFAGKSTFAHKAVTYRSIDFVSKFCHFFGCFGDNCSAACEDERFLCIFNHLDCRFDVLIFDCIYFWCNGCRSAGIVFIFRACHILCHIYKYRSRASALCNIERSAYSVCQSSNVFYDKAVLCDRHYDSCNINLLERILSEKRCSYITCDCHHWYGIHVCSSDSCYQIGSSGTGGCETYTDFAGSSCISVCRMGSSLLMGSQYMCDLVFIFIEGVIYIQDGTARISEYSVNALFF